LTVDCADDIYSGTIATEMVPRCPRNGGATGRGRDTTPAVSLGRSKLPANDDPSARDVARHWAGDRKGYIAWLREHARFQLIEAAADVLLDVDVRCVELDGDLPEASELFHF
jgi:hypothetical protein